MILITRRPSPPQPPVDAPPLSASATTWLTAADRERVDEAAALADLSRSAWCRRVILAGLG